MRASAPGKLLLLGEYGVLERGRALVAAVDRRAVGSRVQAGEESAIASAVRARAGGWDGGIAIDTSAFRGAGGTKLGIGSSAAAAVVASALITGREDDFARQIAIDAHRDISGGEGSGVDVASAFFGGVIASARQPAEVLRAPIACGALKTFVLFTGRSASTSEMVAACRRAPSWPEHASRLADLAEAGILAWCGGDEAAFLDIVRRHGRALARLGDDAAVPIVTSQIRAIMDASEEIGAAAKPSGAGGGDVAVVFSSRGDAGTLLAERSGTRLLDLSFDARGLILTDR